MTKGLPVGFFDVVVLNSVVRLFSECRLSRAGVAFGGGGLLAPGGAVFVGDVRNLRLLRSFPHRGAVVSLLRRGGCRGGAAPRGEQNVLRELLSSPRFFTALEEEISGIGGVDIRLKRGWHHNELSRYR